MILFYILFSSLSPLILKTQQNWDGQITQSFTSCQSKFDVSIKGQYNAIINVCTSQIQIFLSTENQTSRRTLVLTDENDFSLT